MNALQTIIEQAWENRVLLQEETTTKAIREVIVIRPGASNVLSLKETQVNEWVKKAVVMYFSHSKWKPGKRNLEHHDKMELKRLCC
jgi:2,3,4,5-tetrahydropyridine-2-carboxylate N-succinyltransferase